MIDMFIRTGPLMDAGSYPAWAQQLINDCSEAKTRVVGHELYQRMRDGQLSSKTMRQYLIGGWPVVEQFAVYMAHNLTKTRFARHPGEDMARRWLMRNIRVELNHADYWVNWSAAHGVTCKRSGFRQSCTHSITGAGTAVRRSLWLSPSQPLTTPLKARPANGLLSYVRKRHTQICSRRRRANAP